MGDLVELNILKASFIFSGVETASVDILIGNANLSHPHVERTASLPEIVNGFDLAGTCLAYVKRDEIVTGESISPGEPQLMP